MTVFSGQQVAIADQRVIFSELDATSRRHRLTCLAVDDGQLLWHYAGDDVGPLALCGEVLVVLPSTIAQRASAHHLSLLSTDSGHVLGRIPFSPGSIYSTLVASATTAYVTSVKGELACFDVPAQKALWVWQFPAENRGREWIAVPGRDTIFAIGEHAVYALDCRCDVLWQVPVPATVKVYPPFCRVIADKLIIGGKGSVAALDTASGQVLWSRDDLTGLEQVGIVAEQRMYVAASREHLTGIGADDGTTKFTRPIRTEGKPCFLGLSLTVAGGFAFLYPMEDDGKWHLHAIPLDGEGSELRDPIPFEFGLPVVSSWPLVFAFGLEQLRAYDMSHVLAGPHLSTEGPRAPQG